MAIFYLAGISIAFYSRVADYNLLGVMIPLILVGRAINIFPLSFLMNKNDKKDQITIKEQCVMWHAGLRGAIAFSIALHFPGPLKEAVIDCTSQIILLSVFILGGTTSRMLKLCDIKCGDDVVDSHSKHVEAVKDAIGSSRVKSLVRNFDKSVLEKYLVKEKMRNKKSASRGGSDGVGSDLARDTTLSVWAGESII